MSYATVRTIDLKDEHSRNPNCQSQRTNKSLEGTMSCHNGQENTQLVQYILQEIDKLDEIK